MSCSDHPPMFLRELPKCEHHLHIEGTLSPELLFNLASKNSISLPTDDPAFASPATLKARYENFASLDDFLHYYFIGFKVLTNASDFEALTYDYIQNAAGQNVKHAEIFFDPQAHTERGITYDTLISGLKAAKTRAAAAFPDMSIEFIPCLVRHLPVPTAHTMLEEIVSAGHFHDGTVIGFGMSSTEKDMHPSLFSSVYKAAQEAGIENLTAHYGEEGPASYMEAAIEQLSVVRVDHGRRVIEDPSLVARLAESKLMLTLCPVSNVRLRGVSRIEDLPIRELLDKGVRFSINSDDPAYFGADILGNYEAVQLAFDLTIPEWEGIALGSIEGSWCNETRKQELRQMVRDVVQKFS
ncbi:unnamed protein product [Clonostachys rosea f. rosea IK726]|uniref:Uncharacterized protein n=1 Tax=Clonostachys rosea f. rosea IK726 TaxID=1349383 RepID=A0ACA9TLZ2_BIOOC|nr:unnamed protein product [Clonostachys rosea f. rosea IK726]